MRNIKYAVFTGILLASTATIISIDTDDSMIDEFVMVTPDKTTIEVNNDKSDSKSVTQTIKNAKEMITKAESNLNKIKDAVESTEVTKFVNTLKKMKDSLKKMVFKNGPGFQIRNKTEESIWISLVVGNNIVSNQDELNRDRLEPGEKLTMEIQDLSKDMMIGIYTEDPDVVTLSAAGLSPQPKYIFSTTEGARGKTKYFSWNPGKHKVPSKYLYPQTGRWAGTIKVSRSNYNLNNNIKAFQLKLKEQR